MFKGLTIDRRIVLGFGLDMIRFSPCIGPGENDQAYSFRVVGHPR